MGISEFQLIRNYFAEGPVSIKRSDLILGIGDDAAIVSPYPDHELVVAVDTLVAGVHFPETMDPCDIGYRSLAVNLSDLAAMGAEPAWFTLALTLPDANEAWLHQFSQGLFELANQHQIALVGGDTTRGPLTISIQVLGYVPPGRALRREGAVPGDLIYVTGYLGDAAAGLDLQAGEGPVQQSYLQRRFSRPQPRLEVGQHLRSVAHAAIDISDGLLADVGHIAERSGVGAGIQLEKLPLSAELTGVCDTAKCIELALTGGDDYELCFCAPAESAPAIEKCSREFELPITCIGQIEAQPGVRLYNAEGELVERSPRAGYLHFK